MPGHMNVLLAEANVPYPQLKEMDEINPEFPRADVALVVGANDVTNPAARSNPASPIYGMPILDVDAAKNIIVIKRSMGRGYAGIDNELYTNPKTGHALRRRQGRPDLAWPRPSRRSNRSSGSKLSGMPSDLRVEHQAEVPGRREELFKLVSTSEGLSRWLDGADLTAAVGGTVRLELREAVAVGVVLAIDPPQHISWTWDWEGEPLRAHTVVAFDLIDHAARTHLTIRHVGFLALPQP